GGSRM
ncbi:PTS system2C lactose-specific IIA component (EC 2.7.1.69), partial [Terribacillus sp. AE2B 122]